MSDPNPLPNSVNLPFVEELQAEFQRDPSAVPAGWRRFFEQHVLPTLANGNGAAHAHAGNGSGNGHAPAPAPRLGPAFQPRSIFNPIGAGAAGASAIREAEARQDRIDQMVRAYRVRGHMIAQLDPLGLPRTTPEELDPAFYGFTEADMDRPASSRTIKGPQVQTLRQIIDRLRSAYCRYIGVQFMHIDEYRVRQWLQERMEAGGNRVKLSRTEQFRVLTRLTDAVIFEEFIQKKFIGAKSFSLEGGESLIPLLDMAIEHAGEQGIDEVVIAMAHRGRLNVLCNIMGKAPRDIFAEFKDLHTRTMIGQGDVKYHLGYHGDWLCAAGKPIHLALCFNPSHLEYVNPVAMGRMRAKMDRAGDLAHERGLVIQIHGDAAFAGEGIVQETLQLSELAGYRTGGSLHIIVNNQIGFTTAAHQARSSTYATGIGKMLQIPIFHVNGEDPESVAQVIRLASDFRHTFKRDAIVDLWCYRRRGHNEADEPAFTQPVMYSAIRKRPSVRDSYLQQLVKLGDVTAEAADEIKARLTEYLEAQFSTLEGGEAPPPRPARKSILRNIWSNYRGGPDAGTPEAETHAARGRLAELLAAQARVPEKFTPHPTLAKLLQRRQEMAAGRLPLDWAAGEALAFATLATQGVRIRMSGQDAERGTFSHRHAVLHDYATGETYTPLQHLAAGQAPVEIYNSPLNESGVLGFEYGYAMAYPDALVLWEAQFGDFVNVAQVVIDQFLSSAEDKWGSLNGLVMLLPHGYEGQGPEHSSARIERFLQLAAEDNMQICNLTTPAQIFHGLRRQALRAWRKPLVIFTPKSLLRHPKAVSTLDELAGGRFERIIPDAPETMKSARRVLMCSGKVYYELLEQREKLQRPDVAIVRLEQLYPLQDTHLNETFKGVKRGVPVRWVQEEPLNMGAWTYLRMRLGEKLLDRHPLSVAAREASASPATGSSSSHKKEQQAVLDAAFE